MKVIRKFLIKDKTWQMSLPMGAKIIHVGTVGNLVAIWAECLEGENTQEQIRTFHIFQTGVEMPPDLKLNFLGSVIVNVMEKLEDQMFAKSYEWHVYEEIDSTQKQ